MVTISMNYPSIGETLNGVYSDYVIYKDFSSSGGFAKVYDAYDAFDNLVVVKVFKPNKTFEEVQKDWEKEIDFLLRFRHPNIVYIRDAFIHKNACCIVMDKEWRSIQEHIQEFPMNTLGKLKDFARQMLCALHYIHREGAIHRDLHSKNILVSFQSNASNTIYKIADFGISENSLVSDNQTLHKFYLPPEFVNFGYTSHQSDLYQLGIVLYYCYTQQMPYEHYDKDGFPTMLDIQNGIPRQKAEALKNPIGSFIAQFLRRSEEWRFQSALHAWNELKKIA